MGKNLENYETICNETNIYEQKPMNAAEFKDAEQSEVWTRVEKRKEKRRQVAKKNKLLKKRKKQEEFNKNKEPYWKHLGELNKQFKTSKKLKKKLKKCLSQS